MVNPNGRGMGATVADLDNDGLLGHLRHQRRDGQRLLPQPGQGQVRRRTRWSAGWPSAKSGQGVSSMGPDAGDVDRDGWLDLYIPDMDYGCLLRNQKEYFEDLTTPCGLALMCGQFTGWGGLLFDYDNDGYWMCSWPTATRTRSSARKPCWPATTAKAISSTWPRSRGRTSTRSTWAAGPPYGDFDNDGDLDLVDQQPERTRQAVAERRRQPEPLADDRGQTGQRQVGRDRGPGQRHGRRADAAPGLDSRARLPVAVRPAAAFRPGHGREGRPRGDPLARRPHDAIERRAREPVPEGGCSRPSDGREVCDATDRGYADGVVGACVGRSSCGQRPPRPSRPRQPVPPGPSTRVSAMLLTLPAWLGAAAVAVVGRVRLRRRGVPPARLRRLKVCGECHEGPAMGNQLTLWLHSRHAKAYTEPGQAGGEADRQMERHPEEPQESAMCLGCHATASEAEPWERDETFSARKASSARCATGRAASTWTRT